MGFIFRLFNWVNKANKADMDEELSIESKDYIEVETKDKIRIIRDRVVIYKSPFLTLTLR